MKPKFTINPYIIPLIIAVSISVSGYIAHVFRVPTYAETKSEQLAAAESKNIKTASFEVNGVTCFGTSKTLAKWVNELPGILKIYTYTANREVLVTYDSKKTGVDEIIMAVEKEVKVENQSIKPFFIVKYRADDASEWVILRAPNKKIEVDEL